MYRYNSKACATREEEQIIDRRGLKHDMDKINYCSPSAKPFQIVQRQNWDGCLQTLSTMLQRSLIEVARFQVPRGETVQGAVTFVRNQRRKNSTSSVLTFGVRSALAHDHFEGIELVPVGLAVEYQGSR